MSMKFVLSSSDTYAYKAALFVRVDQIAIDAWHDARTVVRRTAGGQFRARLREPAPLD